MDSVDLMLGIDGLDGLYWGRCLIVDRFGVHNCGSTIVIPSWEMIREAITTSTIETSTCIWEAIRSVGRVGCSRVGGVWNVIVVVDGRAWDTIFFSIANSSTHGFCNVVHGQLPEVVTHSSGVQTTITTGNKGETMSKSES